MSIIWATRGYTWGFRFLRDGGYGNVLSFYEQAFSSIGDSLTEFCINDDSVAVRFADPLNRKDRSGRVIPHEFVISEPEMDSIGSIDDVMEKIWSSVEVEYAEIWNQPR